MDSLVLMNSFLTLSTHQSFKDCATWNNSEECTLSFLVLPTTGNWEPLWWVNARKPHTHMYTHTDAHADARTRKPHTHTHAHMRTRTHASARIFLQIRTLPRHMLLVRQMDAPLSWARNSNFRARHLFSWSCWLVPRPRTRSFQPHFWGCVYSNERHYVEARRSFLCVARNDQ